MTSNGFTDTDRRFMARALELAARARGRTSPNPMVGCVAVRDGAVVGEGFHAKAGEPHAEVNAVNAAGSVDGATLYLTLEPCTHAGRTPPCADFLIAHKPARVVVATEDPNPRVAGGGVRALREAGIAVDVGLMAEESRRLNEVFNKYITTGLPFVIAKCAMTLDGKIATRTGHSKWVTGEAARALVHQVRDEVDAILVGSRTVMLDDPSLTTRTANADRKDPIRVILDAGNYLDGARRIFSGGSTAPTWVAVPEGTDFEGPGEALRLPGADGGVDMAALMRELGRREVTSVLIEGGGTTHASAFAAGVVDKVMFFVAPKIAGGVLAVTPVEGEGVATMDEAIPIRDWSCRAVGEDFLIEGYVG